jgi:hypothetical protein
MERAGWPVGDVGCHLSSGARRFGRVKWIGRRSETTTVSFDGTSPADH